MISFPTALHQREGTMAGHKPTTKMATVTKKVPAVECQVEVGGAAVEPQQTDQGLWAAVIETIGGRSPTIKSLVEVRTNQVSCD